jgi:hypothetical protein
MGSQTTITDLFSNAEENGSLSQTSLDILTDVDVGQDIMANMGVSVDDVLASETLLISLLIDDSSSINHANNAKLVRAGCNEIIKALKGCTQNNAILIQTQYINGKVLDTFRMINEATALDSKNYSPSGITPLFDQTVRLLGTTLAKCDQFEGVSVPHRSISIILTDAADVGSTEADERSCNSIISDMLAQEIHIVGGMGIDDGGMTDFHKVFSDMGIRPEWIITPGNNASEIRAAFGFVSQSVSNAAQNSGSFSKTSQAGMGGNFI